MRLSHEPRCWCFVVIHRSSTTQSSSSSFRKLSWKALHGLIPTPSDARVAWRSHIITPVNLLISDCSSPNQSVWRGIHTLSQPAKVVEDLQFEQKTVSISIIVGCWEFKLRDQLSHFAFSKLFPDIRRCGGPLTHTNTSLNAMSCRLSRNQSRPPPPRRPIHTPLISRRQVDERETAVERPADLGFWHIQICHIRSVTYSDFEYIWIWRPSRI